MKTFRKHLERKLQDKEFAADFECERDKLRIAYDIHAARIQKGFTQAQLAEQAGLTQQMISRAESARIPNMAHRTLCQIAKALDMDVGLVSRQ